MRLPSLAWWFEAGGDGGAFAVRAVMVVEAVGFCGEAGVE